MQRRVAAIYFAFFVIVGAGAYSVMAVADAPHISVEGEQYQTGDTITADGQTYTFDVAASVSEGGGGHGGGGGASVTREATLTWTNESARYTATLANNSTMSYGDGTYRILVPNETDPDAFTLREELNVTGILVADEDVYNEVSTINGTKYVTYRENDSNVRLDAYLPDPETEEVREGGTLDYQNRTTNVENVTRAEVLLAWTAPRENSKSVEEGGNLTVGDTQYVAHFPSNETVVLSENYGEYRNQVEAKEYFHERMNGLWGIVIIAGVAALLIISMAYLPFRG